MVKTSYILIENVFRTMRSVIFFCLDVFSFRIFLCIHRYSLKLFPPFNFEIMIKLWSQTKMRIQWAILTLKEVKNVYFLLLKLL